MVIAEAAAGRLVDGSALPTDYLDFDLCREMGWSEAELEATSARRRLCWPRYLWAERRGQSERDSEQDPQANAAGARNEIERARAALPDFQPPS